MVGRAVSECYFQERTRQHSGDMSKDYTRSRRLFKILFNKILVILMVKYCTSLRLSTLLA